MRPPFKRSKSSTAITGVDNGAFEPFKQLNIDFVINRPAYNLHSFDKHFQHIDQPSDIVRAKNKLKQSFTCNARDLLDFIPIIQWLPRYDWRAYLRMVILAAVTVGLIHIPQSVAYSNIIPVPAIYGLYASLWPCLVYPIFGTALHASIGTYPVAQLMVRQSLLPVINANITDDIGNQEHIIDAVCTLSFLVGIVQLLLGIFKLNFLAAYMGDQLIAAFTCSSAIYVITSLSFNIFAIPRPETDGVGACFLNWSLYIQSIFSGEANYITILITFCSVMVMLLGKIYLNPPFKKKFGLVIPFEIIVIIISTTASYFIGLRDHYNVNTAGTIPMLSIKARLPNFTIMTDYIYDAIAIGIVTFVIIHSTSKRFAKKHGYRIDSSQEPYAIGVVNLVSSSLSGFAACTEINRCALLSDAGPATLAGTFGAGLILVVVTLFVGPLLYYTPICILTSITIVALRGFIWEFVKLPELYRQSKVDVAIWLVTFTSTLVLGVRDGLIASLAFALTTTVWRTQFPPTILLNRLIGTALYRDADRFVRNEEIPGVKIFRFDSPLMFINSGLFRKKLYNKCGIDLAEARRMVNEQFEKRQLKMTKPKPTIDFDSLSLSAMSIKRALKDNQPTFIIIDCAGFNYLDAQGLSTLVDIVDEMHQIHIIVLLAAVIGNSRSVLTYGMHATSDRVGVNPHHVFPTVHDAVLFAQQQLKLLAEGKTPAANGNQSINQSHQSNPVDIIEKV